MSNGIPFPEMIERQMREDPEFRAYWERTAFARALGIEVLKYRNAHDMTAEDLATSLGVSIETVETLEDGEENPSFDLLQLLADRLGFVFNVTVTVETPQIATDHPPTLHTRLIGTAAA